MWRSSPLAIKITGLTNRRVSRVKYAGTIVRIQHSRAEVTLIIGTGMGLRGIELDRDLWAEIICDFKLEKGDDLVGWAVEYDPAHGNLEITAPAGATPEEDDSSPPG
jgi:hypothetical protein